MEASTDTMLVRPDFTGIQDRVGEGVYKVRVVDSKVDQWLGKDGKPPTMFIAWTLETFDEADTKNNGRKVFHRTPINGGGAFKLQDFYRATTGLDCPTEFDRTMLHGTELEITVAAQKDKPEFTEVKAVRAIRPQ